MQIRFNRPMLPIIAVVLLSLFGAGCKHGSKDPFPASGEVSGWQKSDATRVFAASDLWQYVDGDSEQYLQAGVTTTSTSDYKYHDKLEAVIDVHTMKDASGAQRILKAATDLTRAIVRLGDSAFAYTQSVVFRKGATLVRIVAYQPGPETSEALLALAHGVERKL